MEYTQVNALALMFCDKRDWLMKKELNDFEGENVEWTK
jgi:hypothetical protein